MYIKILSRHDLDYSKCSLIKFTEQVDSRVPRKSSLLHAANNRLQMYQAVQYITEKTSKVKIITNSGTNLRRDRKETNTLLKQTGAAVT